MGDEVTIMQAITPESMRTQPQKVCHWYNLIWWLVVICAVVAIQMLHHRLVDKVPPPVSIVSVDKDTEKEAFIALAFGKVSATHELAISAASFEKQLASLKQAGYSSVRLEQINQWRQSDSILLPPKPVLLTFEEANRETMQIADKILANLGMTALVFIDVNQLNQGNIQLVSWHQLEQLVNNGRWEVGVSGCPYSDGQAFTSPTVLAQKLKQQREQLEQRLEVPVIVADCSRRWDSGHYDGGAVWTQALEAASLPVGFVAAPFGANYGIDPQSSFRRIRVSRTWGQQDLLSQLNTHAPRRTPFIDKFQTDRAASEWVVDSGDIALEDGGLKIFNKPGEQGALITLGGTEKWQDADVEVQLKGQPEGQFWISLRHQTDKPFVRLGLSEGQVMLQKSDGIDTLNQLAGRASPTGDITLKLRVVGSRATAYVNGQALLSRPIEMPEGVDHGAFAMAVWNGKNTGIEQVNSEKALVNLAQIKATPLFPKAGIVAPIAEAGTWAQLNQQADELAMISPRYFSWIDGKPQASTVDNVTMEIFARYHHLKLLPALAIDGDTPLSDGEALAGQALTWAANPAYDGLNIILKSAMANEQWQAFLRDLSQRMAKIGKTLTVTLVDNNEQALPISGNGRLLLVAAHADLLPAAPRLLYPVNTELALVP